MATIAIDEEIRKEEKKSRTEHKESIRRTDTESKESTPESPSRHQYCASCVLQIHDELVYEVRTDKVEWMQQVMTRCMQAVCLPLTSTTTTGPDTSTATTGPDTSTVTGPDTSTATTGPDTSTTTGPDKSTAVSVTDTQPTISAHEEFRLQQGLPMFPVRLYSGSRFGSMVPMRNLNQS